jgi:hypothetical protein
VQHSKTRTLARFLLSFAQTCALAQTPAPDLTPTQMISAQQAAMAKLSGLDGMWRGTGSMIDRPGETPRHMTQSLRVGPFLDGTVKVIEVRGYLADGSLGFHAFNTISFDAQKGEYVITARAGGRSGNFSFRPTADGYVWIIGSTNRGLQYTGTLKDGNWTEVGEGIAPEHVVVHMSDWNVRKIGNTDWPEAGAVQQK